jgi:transposase
MVKAPTPDEEDRRRICRVRKTLVVERVEHVNRIKGLLFAQGAFDYEPLKRNRRMQLEHLRTGDGRPLPRHLMAQISRELDRLEIILTQLKAVEAERDALLESVSEEPVIPSLENFDSRDDSRISIYLIQEANNGGSPWLFRFELILMRA